MKDWCTFKKSLCRGGENQAFSKKANESVNWNNISEGHFVNIHQKSCKLFFSQQTMDSFKRK